MSHRNPYDLRDLWLTKQPELALTKECPSCGGLLVLDSASETTFETFRCCLCGKGIRWDDYDLEIDPDYWTRSELRRRIKLPGISLRRPGLKYITSEVRA